MYDVLKDIQAPRPEGRTTGFNERLSHILQKAFLSEMGINFYQLIFKHLYKLFNYIFPLIDLLINLNSRFLIINYILLLKSIHTMVFILMYFRFPFVSILKHFCIVSKVRIVYGNFYLHVIVKCDVVIQYYICFVSIFLLLNSETL